jgi:hypothetical protein
MCYLSLLDCDDIVLAFDINGIGSIDSVEFRQAVQSYHHRGSTFKSKQN